MADEKTGSDASNAPKNTKPTGAPGLPDAPVPSPAKPPVSNLMPHQPIVPTEPLMVPPGPPVTSKMPPRPEIALEITVPAPPDYSKEPAIPPAPEPTPTTHERPAPLPAQMPSPVQDEIEAEVGLVKPPPRAAAVPDPMRQDMAKILQGIKLPEKRAYIPDGDKRATAAAAAASVPADPNSLDAVLAARITENPVPTPAPATEQIPLASAKNGILTPPSEAPSPHVPQQDVFHEDMSIEAVHTLKNDLQHVVREQKMSVVRAVALEQEKKRPDRIDAPPEPKSKLPSVILSIIVLFMLGGGALGGVYYVASLQSAPAAPVQDDALVFAEQTLVYPIPKDSAQSIKTTLSQARNSGGSLGALMHIVPAVSEQNAEGVMTQRPATLDEFFKAIGANPPDALMRALGDKFFFGVHTVDKNAPILVLEVDAYDRAFDGMLTWESSLNGDLAPIFMPVPRLTMGADGIQIQRPYTDLVMRNYDVRALKDDAGVIQLYYSFPTRDLLIIAESPYTFTEILSRLQAGRRL